MPEHHRNLQIKLRMNNETNSHSLQISCTINMHVLAFPANVCLYHLTVGSWSRYQGLTDCSSKCLHGNQHRHWDAQLKAPEWTCPPLHAPENFCCHHSIHLGQPKVLLQRRFLSGLYTVFHREISITGRLMNRTRERCHVFSYLCCYGISLLPEHWWLSVDLCMAIVKD